MPSQSEASFGARLRHAQQMVNFIQTYPNYNPPRQEESIAALTAFLQNISNANAAETAHRQNYNTATTARRTLHINAPNGLNKSLVPIRGYVLAQYGKNSLEFKQINTLVAKMREGRLLKTVAADKVTEIKISQSQQSYGSQSKLFGDIIATLSTLPNYNPSNTAIQIPQLQAILNQSVSLSDNVSLNYLQFTQINRNRSKMYAGLADRAQRVKNYVKSQYGFESIEYQFISNLHI